MTTAAVILGVSPGLGAPTQGRCNLVWSCKQGSNQRLMEKCLAIDLERPRDCRHQALHIGQRLAERGQVRVGVRASLHQARIDSINPTAQDRERPLGEPRWPGFKAIPERAHKSLGAASAAVYTPLDQNGCTHVFCVNNLQYVDSKKSFCIFLFDEVNILRSFLVLFTFFTGGGCRGEASVLWIIS
jgi:hypothetical protein